MRHRQQIEKNWASKFDQAKLDLKKAIPDNRINENHALILAFCCLLNECFNIKYEIKSFLEKIGRNKMKSCQQRTQVAADYFFDALDELPDQITGTKDIDDYSCPKNAFYEIRDGELFLHKVKAEKAIRAAGMIIDYPERLGASLQAHPAFERSGVQHRFKGEKNQNVRAMVFNIKKLNV
jgi:hypothetical protein